MEHFTGLEGYVQQGQQDICQFPCVQIPHECSQMGFCTHVSNQYVHVIFTALNQPGVALLKTRLHGF